MVANPPFAGDKPFWNYVCFVVLVLTSIFQRMKPIVLRPKVQLLWRGGSRR